MIGRVTNFSDLCVTTAHRQQSGWAIRIEVFLFEFTIVVFRFKDFGSLKIDRDASPLMAAHSFFV